MKITERIAKLIDVKSIITFVIIGGMTYGFIVGSIDPTAYAGLGGSIIAYYFTKSEKQ